MERPDEVAFELGRRVRAARLRLGLTQRVLGERLEMSSSAVSRLELGHAAHAPLSDWIAITEMVGIDILRPEPDRAAGHLDAIVALAALGGWAITGRSGPIAWFARAARPAAIRRTVLPAEQAALMVVPVLTDPRAEFDRIRAEVAAVDAHGPAGPRRSGVVVVARTAANVRRATRAWRDSSTRWRRCLTTPDVEMPAWSGLVWLADGGTHILPGV